MLKCGGGGSLAKALFLCSLAILFLARTLCATEITSDYTGGTVSGGMIIDPSSNAINISGNTTISGGTTLNYGTFSFHVYNGNLVTIASGATIGSTLSNEIAFLFGSTTNIAGTVDFTTAGRVRFGVAGPEGTGTMNVTGTLNVKTTNGGALYFANGGGSAPRPKPTRRTRTL